MSYIFKNIILFLKLIIFIKGPSF